MPSVQRKPTMTEQPRPAYEQQEQLALLGKAVCLIREENNLSLSELAAAARMTQSRLTAIEAGELDPDFELLLRLADSLHTRPSEFVLRAEALDSSR